jgi:uncharacterized coiled-coil DUF342 family protein
MELSKEFGLMEEQEQQSGFRSRLSALVWFFRKSRDGWKKKYQKVKQEIRGSRSELRDVRRSREKWRMRVEELEQENRALREQLAKSRSERSETASPPAPRRPFLVATPR